MPIKAEAEYRVRCVRSRADVSRERGVPLTTLAQWVCQDGWRRKNLEVERGSDAMRRLWDRLIAMRAAKKLEAEEGTSGCNPTVTQHAALRINYVEFPEIPFIEQQSA